MSTLGMHTAIQTAKTSQREIYTPPFTPVRNGTNLRKKRVKN